MGRKIKNIHVSHFVQAKQKVVWPDAGNPTIIINSQWIICKQMGTLLHLHPQNLFQHYTAEPKHVFFSKLRGNNDVSHCCFCMQEFTTPTPVGQISDLFASSNHFLGETNESKWSFFETNSTTNNCMANFKLITVV